MSLTSIEENPQIGSYRDAISAFASKILKIITTDQYDTAHFGYPPLNEIRDAVVSLKRKAKANEKDPRLAHATGGVPVRPDGPAEKVPAPIENGDLRGPSDGHRDQVLQPKTGASRRKEILTLVEGCVCRDRMNTHGDAEDNFADIATILNVVLKRKLREPLDSIDSAIVGETIKLARKVSGRMNLENYVDGAGYNTCGGALVVKALEDAKEKAGRYPADSLK